MGDIFGSSCPFTVSTDSNWAISPIRCATDSEESSQNERPALLCASRLNLFIWLFMMQKSRCSTPRSFWRFEIFTPNLHFRVCVLFMKSCDLESNDLILSPRPRLIHLHENIAPILALKEDLWSVPGIWCVVWPYGFIWRLSGRVWAPVGSGHLCRTTFYQNCCQNASDGSFISHTR